jgi:glycosyltransferase involved in cell wall biosynthesis
MNGLVLIPAHNEADNIGHVLRDLTQQRLGIPVLVVDDGSRDSTRDVALGHNAIVVTHLVNLGYSRALLTGMRYALRTGVDFCLTLDADGQHDPRALKELVDRANMPDSPDLVVGSRFLGRTSARPPWVRRLGMLVFSALTRLVAGRRVTDTTCGLRYWSRAAMDVALSSGFGDLHSEIIIDAIRRGLVVAEVPVEIRHRVSGQSMYDMMASIVYPFRTLLAVLVLTQRAPRPKKP